MAKMINRFIKKNSTMISSLALVVATFAISRGCAFHFYEVKVPETAKRLRSF